MEESGEFSDDGLDEFEESVEDKRKPPNSKNQTFKDKPYDEAYEVSQDLSMAESFDAREKFQPMHEKEKKLKNDKYDEAVEISQSLDNVNFSAIAGNKNSTANGPNSRADVKVSSFANEKEEKSPKESQIGMRMSSEQSKSQSLLNKPFDEAFEFSQSGSDESVDTTNKQKVHKPTVINPVQPSSNGMASSKPMSSLNTNNATSVTMNSMVKESNKKLDAHSSDEEGEADESYEHIEGAYNSKDYANLNVAADVRDLFQYIERYKPQEVELDAPLKCFIPEYIPAIGELDAFLKIPRPDGKEDGTGLKFLDEPASAQSDSTVLELNLRAKSKKLQYGDIVVRSIENADKNPQKVDKWINDINELHRNKPPVQVSYKKNMPDLDKLMEAWSPEMEALLSNANFPNFNPSGSNSFVLPSPDLEVSLIEYVKVLCSLLDIPVYENPIESLHLLFSLYLEFRSNPHFQDRFPAHPEPLTAESKMTGRGAADEKKGARYGGADVLEINSEEYL